VYTLGRAISKQRTKGVGVALFVLLVSILLASMAHGILALASSLSMPGAGVS
jgi:hypothetical protein